MKTTLEDILKDISSNSESILILDNLRSPGGTLLKLLSSQIPHSALIASDHGQDVFGSSSSQIPIIHSLSPSLLSENPVHLARRLFSTYPKFIATLHSDCHEETEAQEEVLSSFLRLFRVRIRILSSNSSSFTLEVKKGRLTEREVLRHDNKRIIRIERLSNNNAPTLPQIEAPDSLKGITTFNLNLDEKERKDRDGLVMPYWVRPQTKEEEEGPKVTIHSSRPANKSSEGNKIFYEADSGDDEDEDDPDYDLDF